MDSRRGGAEDRVDPRRRNGAFFEAFMEGVDGRFVVLRFDDAVNKERSHFGSEFGRQCLSLIARARRSGNDMVRRVGFS